MASAAPGGARGRRKQAKPQRKVELEGVTGVGSEHPTTSSSSSNDPLSCSMSPDSNHNDIVENPKEMLRLLNGVHRDGVVIVPERVLKTGGTADELTNDGVSTKAAVGGADDCDDDIQRYLRRSDTAVIYPEPVGKTIGENVPTLGGPTSVTGKEGDESGTSEYFIRCPQCQKGCQTFQALKEHMEAAHPDLCSENGSAVPAPGAASPTPPTSSLAVLGPFACAQCATSFSTKDQLEKHELLHSPNAQVSCKICNKTFANVYRLQRHMISHDESAVLRKFKCTECDKAFKFKHHLKEHIRIHSGEKPFECGNCGKRFSHSGSYSSHMTSKKCLVMNLKLGRTRGGGGGGGTTPLLDKSGVVAMNQRGHKRAPPANNPLIINNNVATTNHNTFLPILPKYTEAAAAAFLATNPSMHPFYMASHGLLNSNGHTMSPYTIPSLGHLLEQLQSSSPQKSIKCEPDEINVDQSEGEVNLTKSNSSSCGNLVMDEDVDVSSDVDPVKPVVETNGDLEAVKRILDTVNATVTKQFLQANMQKFSDNSSDCQSMRSSHSPLEMSCISCKKYFTNHNELEEHECVRSEGLAAKLEDAITCKSEPDIANGTSSSNEEELDYYKHQERGEDYDVDSESITTTDQLTEDGRKVRVRSLISDEQLKVLKDNYATNPRPKREELLKIADQIGFQVRVVQVWFQNTRARDRREGRLIQVPYNTPPLLPRFPQSMVPSATTTQYQKPPYPLAQSPQSEQPLDLSTRKDPSRESSPASSPLRPPSESHQHNSDSEEAVNLSQKSSRSPTPFHHGNYHYQASNCSSEPRRTPSPMDFNSTSRLAHILSQPHKLALSGMGLVPMERLMQFGQLSRMAAMSPGAEKRSWSECGSEMAGGGDAEDEASKRSKVMKSLGNPMLGNQEGEVEGQFTCDQCDKAFSKQSSLARHKYEHSGQRPHKCDECTKAFKHKHHLTEHKRLHSGEKPFQCLKCLKRFSHSGSFSQHMNHRYSYCKPYRE